MIETYPCITEAVQPKCVVIAAPFMPLSQSEARAYMRKVADFFDIPADCFFNSQKRGSETIAVIRRAVAYRLKNETGLMLKEIAFAIGRKDHTSVIYAIDEASRQFAEQGKKDQQFLRIYDRVKKIPFDVINEQKTA